jgi:hypothetical protein
MERKPKKRDATPSKEHTQALEQLHVPHSTFDAEMMLQPYEQAIPPINFNEKSEVE